MQLAAITIGINSLEVIFIDIISFAFTLNFHTIPNKKTNTHQQTHKLKNKKKIPHGNYEVIMGSLK